VVSPDGHLLDVGNSVAGLEGELGQSAVVVESGHSCEVVNWDIRCVVRADKGVGVSGVADNNGLDISVAVIVDGLANIDEDFAVILEEISTFHSRSTGLGANQEVVVNIFEGNSQVTGDDDFIEEREGAIVELSLDTLEDLFLEGEIEQVEDDALVFTQEFATGNSVDNRVSNLSSSS